MHVTIAIAPEVEAKLKERAAEHGQTVERFVEQVVEREVLGANGTRTGPTTPRRVGEYD